MQSPYQYPRCQSNLEVIQSELGEATQRQTIRVVIGVVFIIFVLFVLFLVLDIDYVNCLWIIPCIQSLDRALAVKIIQGLWVGILFNPTDIG